MQSKANAKQDDSKARQKTKRGKVMKINAKQRVERSKGMQSNAKLFGSKQTKTMNEEVGVALGSSIVIVFPLVFVSLVLCFFLLSL